MSSQFLLIVKIGKTSRGSVLMRLSELYSTGVPVPFECEFAGKVEDEHKVEKAFHMAFGPYRVNPKREFFQIEPEQAITLLQLMITEDVTPTLQREADSIDPETLLDLPHQIQPSPHWLYEGRKLKDIYDNVYGSV